MLPFLEARARLLSLATPLPTTTVKLSEAVGRVLAEPVAAKQAVPFADVSAMDGYAISTRNLDGFGPWSMPVRGESRAGAPDRSLGSGSACRIFTGALVPAGADAIVMQEDVQRDGDVIRFTRRPTAGSHIRRAGSDLPEGAVAIEPGVRLGAGHVSLAAMLGRAELMVARRPVVRILCSGDELRLPGEALGAGEIFESNSPGLLALCAQAGAVATVGPFVRDDEVAATGAITEALEQCDLLVTVGGVSVGDHDVVKAALVRAGAELDFWKVAIKPGKPLAVGRRRNTIILALPGNPAAALVTFGLFGVPLLRALQNDADPLPMMLSAQLAKPLSRTGGRLEFARVRLTNDHGWILANRHENQGAGALTSLAWSDAVALLPPDAEHLDAGTRVDVLRWVDL